MLGAIGLRRRQLSLAMLAAFVLGLIYMWQLGNPPNSIQVQPQPPLPHDEGKAAPPTKPESIRPDTIPQQVDLKPPAVAPASEFGEDEPEPVPIVVPVEVPPERTIKIPQGTYRGFEDLDNKFPQGLHEWLNVPYALPPIGPLRFKPPQPVPDSDTVFNASVYGYRCPSGPEILIPSSEDCLNLNIYRPMKVPLDKKLPVVIHFHGGAFNFGYAQTRNIPQMLAWATEPFMGITFNHRIGALGFLPSKLTHKEGLSNLGLKDQDMLLRWVQRNIREFGGDPDQVTVMGVSAGAHAIGFHLIRETKEKLPFARAIIESGGPTARSVYSPDHPLHEQQFKAFLGHLGLADVPDSEVMEKLRKLPVDDIKRSSERVFDDYTYSVRWPFQPVMDGPGGIIPIAPIEAWRQGTYGKVPILTGFNTNEGTMFAPQNVSSSEGFTSFFQDLIPKLSAKDLLELDKLYPNPLPLQASELTKREEPSSGKPGTVADQKTPAPPPDPSIYVEWRAGFGAQYTRIAAAYGQYAYICPVRQTASFAAGKEPSILVVPNEHSPVYLYQSATNTSALYGARHGDHAAFTTFNPEAYYLSQDTRSIAGTMHAYWTSFILSGSPNTVRHTNWGNREDWPDYRDGGKKVVFGRGNDEIAGGKGRGVASKIVEDQWTGRECDFWWSKADLSEA